MNKTIVGAIAAAILIVIGFYFFGPGTSKNGVGILAERSSLIRYQIDNDVTDYAFLTYNFKKDSGSEWLAQGFVDVNGDGAFTEDEWVIKNAPARVIKDFPNRFSFILPEQLKTADAPRTVRAMLALSTVAVESADAFSKESGRTLDATVETALIDDEFGINVPGASPDLKRGVGVVHYAYADGPAHTGVNADNLPDLAGGPMDCFAIATANNLINMASQHGRSGDIPTGDIPNLLESIKSAMDWNNGITNANFLIGKAQIIADLGWPVETEEILHPTIPQLREALASGDGVEISTTMVNSRSGKADTGHVFTGVSATNQSVSLHDPATPEGTDTLGTAMTSGRTPFIAIDYPLWDGIVVVDAIYIQRWREPQTATTEKSSAAVEEPKTENKIGNDASILEKVPEVEMTFAHVKPGEYSEIYVAVTGLTPGEEITAKLFRDDSLNGAPQVVDADRNGVAHFTFRITQYGHYNVNVTAPNLGYVGGGSVDVQ